eukprot:510483-Pleurochrysis_carterae.AAC.1
MYAENNYMVANAIDAVFPPNSENNYMVVNAIDAVFPPNSNIFLRTLKHRLLPHSKQECDNRSCIVGVAPLLEFRQMQQCNESYRAPSFWQGAAKQFGSTNKLRCFAATTVYACD